MHKGLIIGLIAGFLTIAIGGGMTAAIVSQVRSNKQEKALEEAAKAQEETDGPASKEAEPTPKAEPTPTPEDASESASEMAPLTAAQAQAYLDAIEAYGDDYNLFALMPIDPSGIPQLAMLNEDYYVSVFSVDEDGDLIDFHTDESWDDTAGAWWGLGTYSRYVYFFEKSGEIVSSQTGLGGAGIWYEIQDLNGSALEPVWSGGYDAKTDENGNFVLDENGDVVFDDPFIGRMQDSMEVFEKELNSYLEGKGKEIALSCDDDNGYMSRQEMIEMLQAMKDQTAQAGEASASGSADAWKQAYEKYLKDVISGKEYLPDLYEAITYEENGYAAFALLDITGDGIPELWLSQDRDSDHRLWGVFTLNAKNEAENLLASDELAYCYDLAENRLYAQLGGVMEHYSVFAVENGRAVLQYTLEEADTTPIMYYQNSNQISATQMDDYDREFGAAWETFNEKIHASDLDAAALERAFH